MRTKSHSAAHREAQAPAHQTYLRALQAHPPWDDYWLERRAPTVEAFIKKYGIQPLKPGERSAAGAKAFREWKKRARRKRRVELRRIRYFALMGRRLVK
jgi:hypothetical protein